VLVWVGWETGDWGAELGCFVVAIAVIIVDIVIIVLIISIY